MTKKTVDEGIARPAFKLGKWATPMVRAIVGSIGTVLPGSDTVQSSKLAKPATPSTSPTSGMSTSSKANNTWNRMVGQESRGRQFNRSGGTLTSPKGAIGASQIMPQYGAEFARRAGVDWDERRARTDRDYNLRLGRAQFNHLVGRYKGDVERAAAAYNAGPGNVSKAERRAAASGTDWRRHLPRETRNYIAKTVVGESMSTTKYTREDIINRTIEKYVPRYEEVTPLTLEEQFAEKTQHLSENHVFTLLRLFNDIDKSNQCTMLSMVESDQGVRELLDFAIDKYIATAQ